LGRYFGGQLDNMINMKHALVTCEVAYGRFHHEKGRTGLSTRLVAGLHRREHVEGLSDEAVCARWGENANY